MIWHINRNIKDAACLHTVHIWHHLSSRPRTKSTQTTLVNAPTKNFSPHPARKYGKSTKHSTQQYHPANEGESGFKAESIRGLGAMYSLQSQKNLPAETWRETQFLCNREKEKWIKDEVEWETAGARQRVKDPEATNRQQKEDMERAENSGLTASEPEEMFHEIIVPVWNSLSDIASSDDGVDGEDGNNEETEQGKLSEDDEPGWVMDTIYKMVQQYMEGFWQKQMKLEWLTNAR
jgi:hypothetical protein